MTRNPDVLERLAPLSGAPSRGFEDLVRLRAKRQQARKIGAIAVVTALAAVLLGIGLGTIGDRTKTPANPPDEPPARTFTGMVIRYTGDPYGNQRGDLVAQDPTTGEVRTLLDSVPLPGEIIYSAAISGDGRWVAFNVSTDCGDAGPGLWVTNGVDEPRQLTDPCDESPGVDYGRWEWSPSGAQLLVVLGSLDRDALVLIDPATGDRTDLGSAAGDVSTLAWSPDGAQIAYAAVPTGSPHGISPDGSVYVVSVDGGEHALIAESIGQAPGGEEGAGIQWSPDGRRIAVLAGAHPNRDPRGTLYAMNTDGSDRQPLAQGVLIEHILGSPNVVWSPDGARIAYATVSDGFDRLRIWSAALDGSAPVLVFDATDATGRADGLSGGPVWSPDGTRIAFRYDPTYGDKVWLIANADGTGDVHEIEELEPLSWRGGWYFCECYG